MALKHEPSRDACPRDSELPLLVLVLVLVLVQGIGDDKFDLCVESTSDGPTIGCYINPITAWVDAVQLARAGCMGFEPKALSSLDQKPLCSGGSQSLIADIRIGWPAVNRKIILRRSLALAAAVWPMRLCVPPEGLPASIEMSQRDLAWMDAIHECAGLFAWRETARAVSSWNIERMARTADRALSSIDVTVRDSSRCEELALFDAESEQWHFVPAHQFVKPTT